MIFEGGNEYWITRFLFQRALAFLYLIAFLIVWNQYRALCGENGLLPARLFVRQVNFWQAPSLFYYKPTDNVFAWGAGLGLLLSVLALFGVTDAFSSWVSMGAWFALWLLYSSFVNLGQEFYGFGWEMMLGEVGFIAIFMGSMRSKPSVITIWLLRWVLFRLMFGAGLIKIRGDSCWRDLTCMTYHYETQPSPGPLSWWFHHTSLWWHKVEVAFNHFVELVVPFGYFIPRVVRQSAGVLTIFFQLTLIASGNLSWLNCITIVVALACFDDSAWHWLKPLLPKIAQGGEALVAGVPAAAIYIFTAVVAVLSIRPVLNLLSPTQSMNQSFDPLHLVNTYGAFGSITRTRYEVIFEGTTDASVNDQTVWKEYGFKGKPGDPARRPPQITPYHYKLDWQMWFVPMWDYNYNPWVLNFIAKLLENNKDVLGLLRTNPFASEPPTFVRAELYEYHFAPRGSSLWWERKRVDTYLPAFSLHDERFLSLLRRRGWYP